MSAYLPITPALAIALLLAIPAISHPQSRGDSQQAGAGDLAPDFSLPNLSGKTTRLSEFRGRTVILNFWATWCVPCRKEIPLFLEMEKKYGDKPLAVVGVDTDDIDNETVSKFVREQKIDYTVLLGNDDTSRDYLSSGRLPVTVLIAPDGKIVKKISGEVTREALEKTLAGMLKPAN